MTSLFAITYSAVSILGMLFNALLIYLALYQSPKTIKSYATLIATFGITDFSACFFELFVQQRIIPAGRSLAYVSNGFCKYFSPTTCYVGYSLMLHCFSYSVWLLLLSFAYRYYILSHPSPTRLNLIIIILFAYIPSSTQWISFLWAQDEPSEVVKILHVKYSHYDLDGLVVTGTKDVFCFSALFTILHMTLPANLINVCILILRRNINKKLTFRGVHLSKNTQHLHAQLLAALTCQSLLPGFYLICIVLYSIAQLGIYNHPTLENMLFLIDLMVPFLSPIVSFFFVTAYRHFILRKLFKLMSMDNSHLFNNQVHTTSTHMETIA